MNISTKNHQLQKHMIRVNSVDSVGMIQSACCSLKKEKLAVGQNQEFL